MARWFLYYWQRYIEDTQNEKIRIYKLNQNADLMRAVQPGDKIIAFANDGYNYVVVAIFPVSEAGENPLDDPDRNNYGKYYFKSEKSYAVYFSPRERSSAEETIRSSEITADAKYLGQSFQGSNAFRRILDKTAIRLLNTVHLK